MSAAGRLRKVFAVIVRKAEADGAFAEELLGALGEPVRAAARAPRAPRAAAVDVSGIDLDAMFERLGRAQFELDLASRKHSRDALVALIAREGLPPLTAKATKAELAETLARHVARRLGKVDLGTA